MASLIGTPMYMAPEQFLAQPIDRRVDVYASGVVLYPLLVGHAPFVGPPDALMYQVVHWAHRPPSRATGLQHLEPYDAIIAQARAKQPAQRFVHALAFRDALAAVVGRRHKDAVSDATLTVLLPRRGVAEPGAAEPPGAGTGAANPSARDVAATSANLPAHFSAAELALAEATLARHVGPLAQVLVRRATRDCPDLPALYARLAEQVTDPRAPPCAGPPARPIPIPIPTPTASAPTC